MKAVILVGGRGERLMPLTKEMPKPMLPINGKPVIEYQIELLKKAGISDVIICGHYLFEKISDYFGNGKKFGVKIHYIKEKTPLGTGGAIKNTEKLITGDFLLLNGDIATTMDLKPLIKFHKNHGGIATLVLRKTDHPQDSDTIEMDGENRIIKIIAKNSGKYTSLANTGIFVFKKDIIGYCKEFLNLEKDVIVPILNKERFYGFVTNEYTRDMGTIERYKKVKEDFKNF